MKRLFALLCLFALAMPSAAQTLEDREPVWVGYAESHLARKDLSADQRCKLQHKVDSEWKMLSVS